MAVICATYDEQGTQVYRGTDSRKAEEIAIAIKGISHVKMFHKVGKLVCVNDTAFSQGKMIDHKLSYIPRSEIELLLETSNSS